MITLDFPESSNLRHRVDPNEMIILGRIAVHPEGKLVERGTEPRAYEILVEDEYLTHTIETGTSRSYSRFRLTDAGRRALCLVGSDR
jgi:hypothetical protein